MDYVESIFKKLTKETKRNLVSLALKDGKEAFVRKHKKELKGIQKKYLDAKSSRAKIAKEQEKVTDNLIKEYKSGKLVELEIDLMKAEIEVRSEVIRKIYEDADLNFVQKYIKVISPKLRNEILLAEYKKQNLEFVYRNFGNIDNGNLKEIIIDKELKDKNLKFLYENYDYIYNKDVRDKIIKFAYKEENVEFLNKHLEDMPKNMKLEAAIKFKDLKLSKVELAQLLKK